jgi:hypothetical protein
MAIGMINKKIINSKEKAIFSKTMALLQSLVLLSSVFLFSACGKKVLSKEEVAKIANQHFGTSFVLDNITVDFFSSFYYNKENDNDLADEFLRGNKAPLDKFLAEELPILGPALAEHILWELIFQHRTKNFTMAVVDGFCDYIAEKTNNLLFPLREVELEGKFTVLRACPRKATEFLEVPDYRYIKFIRILVSNKRDLLSNAIEMGKSFGDESKLKDLKILVQVNPAVYYLAPKRLQNDPELINYTYLSQFRTLDGVEENFDVSKFTKRYSKELLAIDVLMVRRFKSKKILDHVIETRNSYRSQKLFREQNGILMFYAKSDYNSAFEKNNMEDIIDEGKSLYYFEIE